MRVREPGLELELGLVRALAIFRVQELAQVMALVEEPVVVLLIGLAYRCQKLVLSSSR